MKNKIILGTVFIVYIVSNVLYLFSIRAGLVSNDAILPSSNPINYTLVDSLIVIFVPLFFVLALNCFFIYKLRTNKRFITILISVGIALSLLFVAAPYVSNYLSHDFKYLTAKEEYEYCLDHSWLPRGMSKCFYYEDLDKNYEEAQMRFYIVLLSLNLFYLFYSVIVVKSEAYKNKHI